MNKVILALMIIGIVATIIYLNLPQPKAQATIQYTKPIGPTQSPPYFLKSQIKEEIAYAR